MNRVVSTGLKARLILGNWVCFVGWIISLAGAPTFWIFATKADFASFESKDNLVSKQGWVTGSWDTWYSENDLGVMATEFSFFDDNGAEYIGVSYLPGQSLKKEAEVTILHPLGRPDKAFIEGFRRGMFSPWVLVVGIVPIVGFELASNL